MTSGRTEWERAMEAAAKVCDECRVLLTEQWPTEVAIETGRELAKQIRQLPPPSNTCDPAKTVCQKCGNDISKCDGAFKQPSDAPTVAQGGTGRPEYGGKFGDLHKNIRLHEQSAPPVPADCAVVPTFTQGVSAVVAIIMRHRPRGHETTPEAHAMEKMALEILEEIQMLSAAATDEGMK